MDLSLLFILIESIVLRIEPLFAQMVENTLAIFTLSH
jgi:hypothetical protein